MVNFLLVHTQAKDWQVVRIDDVVIYMWEEIHVVFNCTLWWNPLLYIDLLYVGCRQLQQWQKPHFKTMKKAWMLVCLPEKCGCWCVALFHFCPKACLLFRPNLHVDQPVIWLKSTGFSHECIGLGKTKVGQLGCEQISWVCWTMSIVR
jgi:hypothetical protein